MIDWTEFERLAAKARGQVAPRIDVTWRVLAAIHGRRQRSPAWDWPMVAFASGALAVATLVALLAYPAWTSLDDPMVTLFRPLSMVFE